eukprot:9121230-Lingulodinium_polyedra.AAC.1
MLQVLPLPRRPAACDLPRPCWVFSGLGPGTRPGSARRCHAGPTARCGPAVGRRVTCAERRRA